MKMLARSLVSHRGTATTAEQSAKTWRMRFKILLRLFQVASAPAPRGYPELHSSLGKTERKTAENANLLLLSEIHVKALRTNYISFVNFTFQAKWKNLKKSTKIYYPK